MKRKGKNVRDQVQRYSNPHERFFSPTLSQQGEGDGGGAHAINKNPHRELHSIPRDAYRCTFAFLMGNVSRGEAYDIFIRTPEISIFRFR